MKLSSVSRMVSTRGFRALSVAFALGLVAGCGDDEGAANTPSSGDAAVTTTSDAAAAETTGEEPRETSEDDGPDNTGGGQEPSDDGGGGGGDTGNTDAGNPASGCGGAGEACCEEAACNGGFVCVGAGPQQPDFGADGGGFGLGDIIGILDDAGLLASDGGIGLPGFDAGGLIAPPSEAAGVCEACGGEGERCCAEDACNDGFSCEAEGRRPGTPRECVANEPAPGDGGAVGSSDAASNGGDDDCGGEGQTCCREGLGEDPYCNDGFECDNPGGPGLDDSSCVAPGGNGGGDAAVECGGEAQPCCEGRGGRGVCDDGFECESHAPRGLEGDLCVEG